MPTTKRHLSPEELIREHPELAARISAKESPASILNAGFLRARPEFDNSHSVDAFRYMSTEAGLAPDGMVTARAAQQDGEALPPPPQYDLTRRASQAVQGLNDLLAQVYKDPNNAAVAGLTRVFDDAMAGVLYHTDRQLTYSREQTALVKKQAKQLGLSWRMADQLRALVYKVISDHREDVMAELWGAPGKPKVRKNSKRAKELDAKYDAQTARLEEAERLYRQAYTAISDGTGGASS